MSHDAIPARHEHSCLFCHRDFPCRTPHETDGESGPHGRAPAEMHETPGACHPRGHRCCWECCQRTMLWVRRLLRRDVVALRMFRAPAS